MKLIKEENEENEEKEKKEKRVSFKLLLPCSFNYYKFSQLGKEECDKLNEK